MTNQDKARECAEEICKGTYGLTQSEVALIIGKHFPPSVPVSRLQQAVDWVLNDMAYTAPEMIVEKATIWHAKLSETRSHE